MKKKLGNVFLILILVGVVIYFLITGVLDLTNKKDLHTINLAGAFKLLEVEHSINGLIPTGRDYYYIGIEEESYDAYIIKASKRWFQNHFDSDYMAKDAGGVRITALAGKVSDHDISRELYSRAMQIEELNYPLGAEYCLNMGYKSEAIIKLIVAVLSIALTITGVYDAAKRQKTENPLCGEFDADMAETVRRIEEINPIFAKCWGVALVITIVLLLKCIL